MTVLALAVGGRGVVDPAAPVLRADDEGVLRGRAVFETVRVYGGRPFRLPEHLDRLARSASRIDLLSPSRDEFERLATATLDHAGEPDAVLRLLWTAGPEGGEPVALALVSAIPEHLESLRAHGIEVIALLGPRADSPWLLGGVKSTSYAVNIAAEAEARRRGADDAVFVDAGGVLLEGPVTNIWWRVGQTLYTPALELGILAGVTRAVVLEEAAGAGFAVAEGAYRLPALAAAEEVFTSSSVREILPVVSLDGSPVGDGRPGPAAQVLQAALRRLAQQNATPSR